MSSLSSKNEVLVMEIKNYSRLDLKSFLLLSNFAWFLYFIPLIIAPLLFLQSYRNQSMICRANQYPAFYMIGTSIMEVLMTKKKIGNNECFIYPFVFLLFSKIVSFERPQMRVKGRNDNKWRVYEKAGSSLF